jgi:hypothetical protein
MGELAFRTTLEPRGPAAAIVLADEQVAQVGEGAKAFPVRVTVNGYAWAGRVARMKGENLVGLNKAIRTAAGVEAGDEVEVTIALDAAPRVVEVPEALARALDADPDGARGKFDALAYSHRKEFARWVAEAKREATRDQRVARAVEMVNAGTTRG